MHALYEIPSLIPDYGDPAGEVRACREDCALFDFSFVRRASVSGSQAGELVSRFANRRVDDMAVGKIRYALRLNEDGSALSDLTLWKMSDEHFEVMSGHGRDIVDLCAMGSADVRALGNDSAILALQGPNSLKLLRPWCSDPDKLAGLKYFEHGRFSVADGDCLVGRLGYTGEAGFELICSKAHAAHLWSLLSSQCTPAGFIAADILRIEAGFPLFWNDFAVPVTPAELGLVQFSNQDAPARPDGLRRICFSATSKEPPQLWRSGRPPTRPSRPGEVAVTSACCSGRVNGVLGLGYVAADTDLERTPLIDPTGQFTTLQAQSLPVYDPDKTRPRAAWR